MNLDNLEERLLRNSVLDRHSGCWVWVGNYNNSGYGRLSVRDASKPYPIKISAHVASVIAFQGKTPCKGEHVDHKCHNPGCINPEHLRVVKAKTNLTARRFAKGSYCTRCGAAHFVGTNCKGVKA